MSQDEMNSIHDAIYEAINKSFEEKELLQIIDMLPSYIKAIALAHGYSDTEFKDNLYLWAQKNEQEIFENLKL